MPRAATSGVPTSGASRLPGGSSSLEETDAWAFANSKRVAELRAMLREAGLDEQGRKPELVRRYAESQCVEDDKEEEGDEEEDDDDDEEDEDEDEAPDATTKITPSKESGKK